MVGMKELGQMLFWGSFYGLLIVKQNRDANVMGLLPQIACLVPILTCCGLFNGLVMLHFTDVKMFKNSCSRSFRGVTQTFQHLCNRFYCDQNKMTIGTPR